MYVADVTSMSELEFLLSEAKCLLADNPAAREQAEWDIEDIEARMAELA